MAEPVPGWSARAVGDGMGAFDHFFSREVLTRFPSAQLRRRSDAARLDLGPARLAVTCDAFTVDPLFFPGGDLGTLALCGTANDLLSEAARPQWLLVSLLIGERTEPVAVRRVLDSLQHEAARAGAVLVGGDTKTVDGPRVELIVTVTGLGEVCRSGPPLGFEQVRPGDELVLTGPVGAHAIAVLSAREGLGFESVVASDCRDVGLSLHPLVSAPAPVRALRDATRGGLLGVLHELSAATGLDVAVDAAAVPVAREVTMAAQMLGIDPLELTNEGCFVIVVQPDAGDPLVAELRGRYGFAQAVRIGTVGDVTGPRTETGAAEFAPVAMVGPAERGDTGSDESGPHRPGRVLLRQEGTVRVLERTPGLGVPRLC